MTPSVLRTPGQLNEIRDVLAQHVQALRGEPVRPAPAPALVPAPPISLNLGPNNRMQQALDQAAARRAAAAAAAAAATPNPSGSNNP
jgi:hypothetical protein